MEKERERRERKGEKKRERVRASRFLGGEISGGAGRERLEEYTTLEFTT